MKSVPIALASLAALLALSLPAAGELLTPAFTYQGRLNQNGSPATDTYDLRFEVYNAAAVCARVGQPIDIMAQAVSGGLFSADLNFGGPPTFDGTAYWLAVSARTTGTLTWSAIPGRSAIRPAPYSIH